jgi:hypothetical protein
MLLHPLDCMTLPCNASLIVFSGLICELHFTINLKLIFKSLVLQQISAAEVPWTKQEEDVLKEAVDRFQGGSQQPIRTWHLHSSILNASIAARGRLRMGKHCMEYWNARLCAPQDPALQQQQPKVALQTHANFHISSAVTPVLPHTAGAQH